MSIAALALDLGNVLVKVDHLRFCRGLAVYTTRSPEEIYGAIFESGLEPAYDTGRLTSRGFYRRIMDLLGLALPYPLFRRLWTEIFDPMEGMGEAAARLKERYLLYLVSNTNPLHFAYIRERFPLLKYFRRFILSYEVGCRKPEAAFYQTLIREVGLSPEQILFVDDKLPFVEAARTHGLTAWLFTNPLDFQTSLAHHGLW